MRTQVKELQQGSPRPNHSQQLTVGEMGKVECCAQTGVITYKERINWTTYSDSVDCLGLVMRLAPGMMIITQDKTNFALTFLGTIEQIVVKRDKNQRGAAVERQGEIEVFGIECTEPLYMEYSVECFSEAMPQKRLFNSGMTTEGNGRGRNQ